MITLAPGTCAAGSSAEAGYEVIEATRGEEALRIAAESRRRSELLDVNLPDISGTEVCERLKRDPATAGIPVIQITGAWRSEEDRRVCMASGANVYLTEPVDEITLLRSVVEPLESATEAAARSLCPRRR